MAEPIDETLPPPLLLAPCDGWTVSLPFLDFRFAIPHASPLYKEYNKMKELTTDMSLRHPTFLIQIATSSSFDPSSLLIETYSSMAEWKDSNQRYFLSDEEQSKLHPGSSYYWRVRVIRHAAKPCDSVKARRRQGIPKGPYGPWSPSRNFAVQALPTPTGTMRHVVDADHPMLVFSIKTDDAIRGGAYCFAEGAKISEEACEGGYASFYPEDLRKSKNVAIMPFSSVDEKSVTETYKTMLDYAEMNGYLVLMRGTFSLCELEWAVKNYNCVIAVEMDEMNGYLTYYKPASQHHPLLIGPAMMALTYGVYNILCDGYQRCPGGGPHVVQEQWIDYIDKYGQNTVWGHKTNINHVAFMTEGIAQGLWLDGLVKELAYWAEGWYWANANYGDPMNFPSVMWGQKFLVGAAQGCSWYFVSGTVFHFPEGALGLSTLHHYVFPLFRAMLQKKLITRKEENHAKVKLGIEGRWSLTQKGTGFKLYSDWEPFYDAAYGLPQENSATCEIIPDTGKNYFIPVFRPRDGKARDDHIKVITLDDVRDKTSALKILDDLYPPFYSGDAWVCRIRNNVFIQNSQEKLDQAQTFHVPLGLSLVEAIHGTLELHTFLVCQYDENSDGTFWLQGCSHFGDELHSKKKKGGAVVVAPVRDHTVSLTCVEEPSHVMCRPQDAMRKRQWDPATKTLTITLNYSDHKHPAQVVVSRVANAEAHFVKGPMGI